MVEGLKATVRTQEQALEAQQTSIDAQQAALDAQAAEQVETEVRYAGYIRRQQARAEQTRRLSARSLAQVDFTRVPGLSMEVRERLQHARPPTLATASRLPGITPAAVDTLAVYLARQ